LVPHALSGSCVCPAAAAVCLRAAGHRVLVPVHASPEVKPAGGSPRLHGGLAG
jgi:hypothetical protein